jgi:hypothetical protein
MGRGGGKNGHKHSHMRLVLRERWIPLRIYHAVGESKEVVYAAAACGEGLDAGQSEG